MTLRFFSILTGFQRHPRGIFLALVLGLGTSVRAHDGNILSDPGFEADPGGQTQTIVGWTRFGRSSGNTFGETGLPARTGMNYFKVFSAFDGVTNYSGIFQDNPSAAGAVYSASGWAFTSASDMLAGHNLGWIEVTFRDPNEAILALYRSVLVATNLIGTSAFPKNTWVNLAVSNQYDPTTLQITNTSANLAAPAGTSFVRYQVTFEGDPNNSGGSLYFDDLGLTQTGGTPVAPTQWNIVWSDEFNGTNINPKVWTFDLGNNNGWGNNELEYYTANARNAYVSNGLLHIAALKESTNGFAYTSARMKTEGLFSRTYGRFEFRAKLPAGHGFWPALWLLGTNITSIGWPACGEIDVVENNGTNTSMVQGSLHSGSDETAIYTLPNGGSVTNFHTYTLDWSPGAIKWFVDGDLNYYETQTSWSSSTGAFPAPFDEPFFIIMNLAVGGNYVGNPSIPVINTSTFPAEMQVDYVRIYSRTAPLQISATATSSYLTLNWPSNIVCHLQSQDASSGLSTNWVNLPVTGGPFAMPLRPTNAGVFYRLVSP